MNNLLNINYRKNSFVYFGVTMMYIIPAIILGVLCEKIIRYLQSTYQLKSSISIILQLFLATLILFLIEIYFSPRYGKNWQEITPGLFFITIFFGLQTSLYKNVFILTNM